MTYGNGELPNGGWIPVEERLPDIHNCRGHYLVTLKNGEVQKAMFTETDGECWWDYNYNDVIAWMPLPAPYRAETEADNGKIDCN